MARKEDIRKRVLSRKRIVTVMAMAAKHWTCPRCLEVLMEPLLTRSELPE